MESKYYNVMYVLSNGSNRVVKDVYAYTEEEAINLAPSFRSEEKVVLEIEGRSYHINDKHIVEIIVEEVPSPEDRKKQQINTLEAFKNMM